MLLTENDKRWANIITEEYHVENPQKVEWMSKMAQIHELKESLQGSVPGIFGGIYSTPLNTLGMGNPMAPQQGQFNTYGNGSGYGNTGADFHAPNYQVGSGDIPMSTLPMALEIAAMTIGFELVPVIPATGPWYMLTYGDVVYAGGKLGRVNETSLDGKGDGRDNKPIYIKVKGNFTGIAFEENQTYKFISRATDTAIANPISDSTTFGQDGIFTGTFLGKSRIDNGAVFKVVSAEKCTGTAGQQYTGIVNGSIADVFAQNIIEIEGKNGAANYTLIDPVQLMFPELVASAADHIQGFSNFFNGSDDPMTRAQNETGVGETMGFRTFSKWVQMGSYEVTGSVTRQQLQDMPLYGVDVIGQVLEYMQNEISQAINNRILDRVFKLGVENYKVQRAYQGVDLNLWVNNSGNAKYIREFAAAKYMKDINGVAASSTTSTDWAYNYAVANGFNTTNYENTMTFQRRIASRVLYAKNLIANVSRRGYADWMVTNFSVISALQDIKGFVVAPTTNTLTQDNSGSLYFAGTLNGLAVYCDPYMPADDMRICVGRKSDGKTPGVIFMPYILCDTIQTIVEGTMAPKLLVNSRFAIVDAGFHPEQNYYTFMLDNTARTATPSASEIIDMSFFI